MSLIVSRVFILFTNAKDNRFTCNLLQYCCQKSTKKDLYALYASDNLVHILLHWGLFPCTHKPQEPKRSFVDAVQSMQGNYCPHHCRPVLNVRIEHGLWKTAVLTSQMDLNILNWAILPCKLQFNTRNQKWKYKLLWSCLHLQVEFWKVVCFLSPEDGTGDPALHSLAELFFAGLLFVCFEK